MPMPKPKLTEIAPIDVAPTTRHAPENEFSGQRRLVRPSMATRSITGRQTALYGHGPTLTSRSIPSHGYPEDTSHAEVFYFQKQIQSQTRMVVILENGQQLEGLIEWYDRYAIKMRSVGGNSGRGRVLIYKDSIRYIYKAGENAPQTMT